MAWEAASPSGIRAQRPFDTLLLEHRHPLVTVVTAVQFEDEIPADARHRLDGQVIRRTGRTEGGKFCPREPHRSLGRLPLHIRSLHHPLALDREPVALHRDGPLRRETLRWIQGRVPHCPSRGRRRSETRAHASTVPMRRWAPGRNTVSATATTRRARSMRATRWLRSASASGSVRRPCGAGSVLQALNSGRVPTGTHRSQDPRSDGDGSDG